MIDFLIISSRNTKRGIEVYPRFRLYPKSQDLMIRGGDFYAIWIEELGLWSTDEQDALCMIDRELDKYAEGLREKVNEQVIVLHMWDSQSGMIDAWHRYCQKQARDNYNMLDETLIFSNMEANKKDYASKRLSYPLEPGEIKAYDKLISTLYSEEERHKIEWAIGSIVSGDSKKIQKFMVLYGAAGTGKSTILNIIQQLFDGYYSVFDAKALGSATNQFSLEAFKNNPLVAIQHDGDLSKIEDNTRLNSLVSHELMTVNEKFKGQYTNRFKCFLFMGTNKPVKITDAKSGLIRRLIDVTPSGNKLSAKEYKTIMKQVSFELGAIAYHCKEVYLANPSYYDDYAPLSMMGSTNDFYNFILDAYPVFRREDGVTLSAAWEMYKNYCEEAKVTYPFPKRNFKEELKNYFENFDDRFNSEDGSRIRSYYSGFRTDKFETKVGTKKKDESPKPKLIQFDSTESIFDKERADCYAQYASTKGTPMQKWDEVGTKLSDLDTSELHYVKVPENHIVIDFDITDENGQKCFEKNLEAASKWPPTSYSPELARKMKSLVPYADILTPNLTEACILTDTTYRADMESDELVAVCEKLSEMGPKKIVISGLEKEGRLVNFVYEEGAEPVEVSGPKIGPSRAGTGDVFSSVIAADVVNGASFLSAVRHAAVFIAKVLARAVELEIPPTDGICFEEFLSEITEGME